MTREHAVKDPAGGYRPRREGQVMIIALLAMTLMVALIFYVYNIGDVVNRRMSLQDTADAVAVSGGGWMARSMNVVAANNCAQTRLMALALVLDSLPLAAEMTIAEETGGDCLPEALRKQLERGNIPNSHIERDDFLRKGLEEIYRQMMEARQAGDSTHLEFLKTIDESLDQKNERGLEDVFDVKVATEWHPGGGGGGGWPEGTIWRAIKALDEFSQATGESAGYIAQRNAVRFARANDGARGFLTPLFPDMPARRGGFHDFKEIFCDHLAVQETGAELQESRLVERLAASDDVLKDIEGIYPHGGAIPDWAFPHRLGPYSRSFYWRYYWNYRDAPWWEPGNWYRRGYSTYGPLVNAINTVLHGFGLMGHRGGLAFTSRMAFHLRRVAVLKLAYIFGLDSPQEIQYADKWITDYDKAQEFCDDGMPLENSGEGSFSAFPEGSWRESEFPNEHEGSSLQSETKGAYAVFTASLPAAGGWKVEVWWSGQNGTQRDEAATITINPTEEGPITSTHDQEHNFGQWVSLGTHDFEKGTVTVTISRGGTEGPTVADAVRFVPVSKPKNNRPGEAKDNEQVVLRTRYYHVGVTSSVPWTDANWLNNLASTYSLEPEEQVRFHSHQLRDNDGGSPTTVGDPKVQPLWEWAWEPDGNRARPSGQKLCDHIWRRTRVQQVIDFEPFGWPPRPILNDKGEIIGYDRYTIYTAAWWVWGGIEIRDPVEISDVLEGVPVSERNAPILLDTTQGDYLHEHDVGFRRERFTYLGLARRSAQAPLWPGKFSTMNPTGSMVTMAQAEVFNNRSFGLWTQQWRVQLVPVTQYDDWMQKMEDGMGDVEQTEADTSAEEVRMVLEYLRALPQPLADRFMVH